MVGYSAHVDHDKTCDISVSVSVSRRRRLTRGVCGGAVLGTRQGPTRHAPLSPTTRSPMFHRQTLDSDSLTIMNRHWHVIVTVAFLSIATLLEFVIHNIDCTICRPNTPAQPCCQSLVCLPSILTLSIICISSFVNLHPNAWILLLACSRFLIPTTGLTPLLML
jgi:hypothetical protein